MRKFNRIYFAVLLIIAVVLTAYCNNIAAVNVSLNNQPKSLAFLVPVSMAVLEDTIPTKRPASVDTILKKVDTIPVVDTNQKARLDTFSLKISKDTLEAPVKYHAEDSAVGMVQEKTIELYGKASTEYKTNALNAPYLRLNQQTGIVTAVAGRDSTGSISDYVVMKDGEEQYNADSMVYNFKTQRGLTKGTITQQGEMFLHADIVKKVDANTVYGKGAFFTTCNLDHPHFGFRTSRVKVVNKKLAVTGAVRPEFDSVPVPIYLPFGFYPLYQGRHSGVMSPSFETNDQMGVGLSGLGYYHVINDHWDVKVYGDVYSFGTWNVNVNPTYRTIYRYQGAVNFGLQSTKRNFRGDADFYSAKTYSLNWSHSSDTRSRPGVTFSANVNASSTAYNRNIPNNNLVNFQNVMGSSITYSKQWIDKPFSLTLSANHNQNNAARLVTVNLPDANFSVSTLYPLQNKNSVGKKKWYEQLGVGYSGSFRNNVAFYDSIKNYKETFGKSFGAFLLDTLQWNANHSIPVTLSLPPILNGALIVSPSISYSQQWVDRVSSFSWGPQTFIRNGDAITKDTIIATSEKGFYIKQQTSFGLSFNTALYGFYDFKKSKATIRHVARPTFGFNYTPDLTRKYWEFVQIDSLGTKAWFNRLDGLYSSPRSQFTSQRNGGINFGLDNNLEMKVRAKPKKKKNTDVSNNDKEDEGDDGSLNTFADTSEKDAEDGYKKIKLIDGFGFNGSYNFLADSLRLSPINIYFRTNLFEKININASANLVPYILNASGYATKDYAWSQGKFSPGTITNASVSMSTSFQSKPKDPEKQKAREKAINESLNDPMLQADQLRLMEYMRQNPAEFVDFNTQWSLNLSFSLNYARLGRNIQTLQGYARPVTASTNFSGSFNLTPKWNFSVNGFYDFSTSKIQTFSMAISRDLHCWQMSINVTPVGIYRFFNFTISPKSGMLQDLKVNRTRSFYTGAR